MPASFTTPPSRHDLLAATGSRVDDANGHAVGVVDAVLVDGEGEPSWIIVRRAGRSPARTAVPAAGSSRAPGRVIVPYDRGWLDAAPQLGAATALGAEHERELSRFYGLAPGRDSHPDPGSPAPTATRARIELWDPEGARRAWLTWGLEDAAWAAGLEAPLDPGPSSPSRDDADGVGDPAESEGLNRPHTRPAGARSMGDIGRQGALLGRTIMAGARSAELRLPRVRLLGGLFWLGGILAVLLLLPVCPPTRAIGSDGWLVAAAMVLAATAVLWRRLGSGHGDLNEMLVAAVAVLVGIGVLEWLAGGRSSPYHELYLLPVLVAAGVQSGQRLAVVGLVAAAAIAAPLVYDSSATLGAAGPQMLGQACVVAMIALAVRLLLGLSHAERVGLREGRRQAEQLARRDPLTGLGNRRALDETLAVEVARSRRSNRPLSLVLADLDGLKRVNDQLGHGAGDLYLRAAARRLTESARQGDVCFRWGGDEFAVVLPEADQDGAEQVLRRMAGIFGRLEDAPLQLSCASATLWEGASGDELLRRADARLVTRKHPVGTP